MFFGVQVVYPEASKYINCSYFEARSIQIGQNLCYLKLQGSSIYIIYIYIYRDSLTYEAQAGEKYFVITASAAGLLTQAAGQRFGGASANLQN